MRISIRRSLIFRWRTWDRASFADRAQRRPMIRYPNSRVFPCRGTYIIYHFLVRYLVSERKRYRSLGTLPTTRWISSPSIIVPLFFKKRKSFISLTKIWTIEIKRWPFVFVLTILPAIVDRYLDNDPSNVICSRICQRSRWYSRVVSIFSAELMLLVCAGKH